MVLGKVETVMSAVLMVIVDNAGEMKGNTL